MHAPSVTCAIPGTYKMEYLLDNIGATVGPMPEAAMGRTIATWYDAIASGWLNTKERWETGLITISHTFSGAKIAARESTETQLS